MSVRVPVGEPRMELIEGSIAPEPVPRPPETQAEEVWQLVQEWYAGRGEPVPDEDRTACMTEIAAEKALITNPPALAPPKRTAVPKAKPPPKTPAAKATAQAGAPRGSKSSA